MPSQAHSHRGGRRTLITRVSTPRPSNEPAFKFDPDRLAYLEAEGWRAYYDRRWPRFLGLLVAVCQEQFHIPFPKSLLAAYYAVRGAQAWAPVNHDARKAHAFYERFYRLAQPHAGLSFEPARVADLEMRYWDDHRRTAELDEKPELLETLVELHSALFGLPPDRARESAEWRTRAAATVDRITSRRSTDVPGDWGRLTEELRRCYRSVQRELNASG